MENQNKAEPEPSCAPSRRQSHAAPARWRVAAAFAAIYVIWGSTYLGIRYGVESIPPFLMAGSRFLAAGALLYAFARKRGAARPNKTQWRDAFIAGGLLLVIGNGGVTWAEQVVPSGVAALLAALVPVWMVLLDWARPKGTRPAPLVFAGLALGIIGVTLLVSKNIHGGGSGYSWGMLALLLASSGWAVGSIYYRHAAKPASPLLGIGMQMIGGGVLLLIAAGLHGEYPKFSIERITAPSAWAWLYLATMGSLVGFSAYIWLLQVSSPARVATYAYVNPFIAVVLGCTLGRESLSREMFLAGAVIIFAVVLIVRGSSAKPSPVKTREANPGSSAPCAASETP